MRAPANLHGVAAALIATKSYNNNPVPTSTAIVSGMNTQANPGSFDYCGDVVQVNATTILYYGHGGGTDDTGNQSNPGYITRHAFDMPSRTWGAVSTVYDPTSGGNAVLVASPYVYNNSTIRVVYAQCPILATNNMPCSLYYIESTDGLIGQAFGAPVLIRGPISTGFFQPEKILRTDNPNNVYIVIGSTEPGLRVYMLPSTDGGNTWSSTPQVVYGGAQQLDENGICYVGNNTFVGLFRVENDTTVGSMMQSNSYDGGVTWSALFYPTITGGLPMGGITGTVRQKVRPKLIRSAGQPGYLTYYFYDRSDARLKIGTPTPIANAIAGNWSGLYLLGTSGKGYGILLSIDDTRHYYLATNNKTNTAADGYDWQWWIVKDVYPGPLYRAPYF